jgi:hypothetical protein
MQRGTQDLESRLNCSQPENFDGADTCLICSQGGHLSGAMKERAREIVILDEGVRLGWQTVLVSSQRHAPLFALRARELVTLGEAVLEIASMLRRREGTEPVLRTAKDWEDHFCQRIAVRVDIGGNADDYSTLTWRTQRGGPD